MSQKAFSFVKMDKNENLLKLSPLRKNRKPLMEKKRRARINDSLEALKEILLKNTVAITQGNRPTKLEKADILEMTVRYLQALHKRNSVQANDKNVDCLVTSTTSPFDKSNSNATVDSFARFSIKTNRFHKNSAEDKENVINSVENRRRFVCNHSNFRPSESSAFRVIKSNKAESNFVKNLNNIIDIQSNPWRPW